MARAQATDPLHSFRFHARAASVAGLDGDPLQPEDGSGIVGDAAEAGFQAVGTPEYTVEASEYREGTRTYTQKYPGVPSTNDVTMSRGVARGDTAFYNWVTAAIEGREYRTDLTIYHATRTGRSFPFSATDDFSDDNSKRMVLFQAFPIRIKPAADLDAATSDVSLAEMDVAFEHFDLNPPG